MENYKNMLNELTKELKERDIDLTDYIYLIRTEPIMVKKEMYFPIIDYYFDANEIIFEEYEKTTVKKFKNELIKMTKNNLE